MVHFLTNGTDTWDCVHWHTGDLQISNRGNMQSGWQGTYVERGCLNGSSLLLIGNLACCLGIPLNAAVLLLNVQMGSVATLFLLVSFWEEKTCYFHQCFDWNNAFYVGMILKGI